MRTIKISILNRGPEIETSIGIFIILAIMAMMIFSAYSAYRNLTETFEDNANYLNEASEL